jgi:multiple sugar transport system ATP-binding protein
MDEPLSNLDAKLRVETRAEISKLHQRLKTTFIYVTHDQTEAMTMGTRIAVMKDGILQQLDTPQTLYDHPANMFVAGFIGSPSMNFFEGTLQRSNGGVLVDLGKFSLPIQSAQFDAVSSHIGKPIFFGIRPEDVHDSHYVPRGVDESAKVVSSVTVVEPLGSEVYAFIDNGGKEMVSRLDPRTGAKVGQPLEVVVDMSKMHIFDRETEKAII